ncbi:MAG: GMC family oxidoreductase [Aquabacterium sp.]
MAEPDCDYLIIGAGSAGCVLAEQLSADGRHRVCLLEAGGTDQRWRVQVPIGYGLSFYDPSLNWMFQTEPQAALAGRRGYWPRGKVLGGSSAINAMVYIRGLPQDYDDWRDEGNPGWGWADVLPHFIALEHFLGAPHPLRGRAGPLQVSDVSAQLHPLGQAWQRAGQQLGLPVNHGFNGDSAEGIGPYELTMAGGRRMSAARAWLRPALRRPNLQVLTDALALQVQVEGGRAVGLRYRRGGIEHTMRAAREVILCAGAVQSPLLLHNSGLGPADVLATLGIPVRQALPAVGRHLQDHLCIDHLYQSRVPTLNQQLRPWWGKLRAGLQYALARRGPLALSVNQGGGFVRSQPQAPRPDLQLYFSPLSYTRAPAGQRPLMSPDPFPGFLLSAQPCRPFSRGQLRLGAPDGVDRPVIEPNPLADPRDLALLLQGSRWLRRLAATPALADVIDAELAPGPAVQDDAALEQHIRAQASTVFHPCGTCRMGPDAQTAVVDARLRVHGMAGLRVVDASVFPSITSGNTNAPTLMVAHRAAQLILEDAR